MLHVHLDRFLDQISLDVGQTKLISAIFENNRQLLDKGLNEKLFDKFRDLILEYGCQGTFLNIFKTIQKVHDHPLVDNQMKTMKFFLPQNHQANLADAEKLMFAKYQKSTRKFLFDFGDKEDEQDPFEAPLNDQLDNMFMKTEPFKYHAELLDVLLNCVKGEPKFIMDQIRL